LKTVSLLQIERERADLSVQLIALTDRLGLFDMKAVNDNIIYEF